MIMLRYGKVELLWLLVKASNAPGVEEYFDQGRRCLILSWPDRLDTKQMFAYLSSWLRLREVEKINIVVHISHNNNLLIPRLAEMKVLINKKIPCELVAINQVAREQVINLLNIEPILFQSGNNSVL